MPLAALFTETVPQIASSTSRQLIAASSSQQHSSTSTQHHSAATLLESAAECSAVSGHCQLYTRTITQCGQPSMAVVPFRVSGPAASQQLAAQLLQVGPYSLLMHQRPQDSGNTAHLQRALEQQQDAWRHAGQADVAGSTHQQQQQQPDLSRVGLVLWQSGYVLSDFLLQRLPQLQAGRCSSGWAGMRVLELGCGAGTVGMFLALAGAQVVLTDQPHILPLALQNLELNFPQTCSKQPAGGAGHSTPSAFGQAGLAAAAAAGTVASPQNQPYDGPCAKQAQPEASAGTSSVARQPHSAPLSTCTLAVQPQPSSQTSTGQEQGVAPGEKPAAAGLRNAQQPAGYLSVAAGLAAAFCGADAAAAAAAAQPAPAAGFTAAEQLWGRAFSAGPLVVQYTWGESTECLQQRVAAAAATRLGAIHTAAIAETAAPDSRATRQHGQLAVPASLMQPQAACYDVVVGADLLYDPACHAALLDSLDKACSAHTEVFLCYRHRGLGEEAFEQAAGQAGWAVMAVSSHLLHPEFQGGGYRLLRMVKTG